MKVSFHQSGSWQQGLTAHATGEVAEEIRQRLGARHMEIWQRPAGEWWGVRAFMVFVPRSGLRAAPGDIPQKPISWVEAPPVGRSAAFAVIFTLAGVEVPSPPRPAEVPSLLIGSLLLPNGETVWLVHYEVTEDPYIAGTLDRIRADIGERDALQRRIQVADPTDLRVLLAGNDADGARYFVDCALI